MVLDDDIRELYRWWDQELGDTAGRFFLGRLRLKRSRELVVDFLSREGEFKIDAR